VHEYNPDTGKLVETKRLANARMIEPFYAAAGPP
jgi:hypothetical protein